MTRFSQKDPQWRHVRIDPAYSTSTIGKIGCVVSSFGMMVGMRPDEVSKRAHFVALGGHPSKVHWVWNQADRFAGVQYVTRMWTGNWGRVVEGVSRGEGVLIQTNSTQAGWNHWLLARSIDGDNVVCSDPDTLPVSEVKIHKNKITGSAHYTTNSSPTMPTKPFHINNESQLNEWLTKWGLARMQEINNLPKDGYGYTISDLYTRIDTLRASIIQDEKGDKAISDRLEQYINDNQQLRTDNRELESQLSVLEKQLVEAAQAASVAAKELNMQSPIDAPIADPEAQTALKEWAASNSERITQKLDEKIDEAVGFDVDVSKSSGFGDGIGWIARKIIDRATSSRFVGSTVVSSWIAAVTEDVAAQIVAVGLVWCIYMITEIFTRYRKK